MAFSFSNPQPQQQASESGFSYGNTQQQKPAGGFSFGQPPANSATSSTGGLFGAASQQQQGTSAPATGGFSFGGAATNTQQQPATGGLFGQSQPQQQGGGLFGNTQQPATGGGLFGSSTNQQPAAGGGLFGSTQTKPTTGLFGSTTAQPQQQQGASLFGSSTAQQPPPNASLFGSTTQPPQQQPEKKLGVSLAPKIEQIRAAWDTNNAAGCRFLYYFYNNAGNTQNLKQISGRRNDAVGPAHDQLWAAAIRENPDPDRLYPVLALGFDDLKKRANSQHGEAARQRQLLAQLSERLASLQQKHSLNNTVRCQAAASRQSQLHHRLVGLVAKAQLLIPALRGKSVGPEEEKLIAVLESCEAEISGATTADAAGHARLRAKVNELWAQLGVVRAKRETLAREGRSSATEWAVVDETGLENVAKILSSQQQGLNHLSTTLNNDARTMQTITSGLTGVKLTGVRS